MSFVQPPQFERLSPSDLAATLRDDSPTAPPKPLIIDVRDEDFAEGHIRSAINVPEEDFEDDDDVDALVNKYKDEERIVFHCMMSQVRGPKCARRFLSRMEVVLDGAEKKPHVEVLQGGFQLFERVSATRVWLALRRNLIVFELLLTVRSSTRTTRR